MINLLATLKFNIMAFGLKKGLRLPVYVYGKIRINRIGKININCPVRRRLICIGVNNEIVNNAVTLWHNEGTIDFNGQVFLNYGIRMLNKGHIVFGGNNIIGTLVSFDINDRLEVGYNSNIGIASNILDSNHHFTINMDNRHVARRTGCIRIGNYNWIGSNTFIKKGCITPDYIIVASPNALLAKDYSNAEPYSVLGGAPAKPIGNLRIRRIYDFHIEREIQKFFDEHPEAEFYTVQENTDLDEYCKLKV